MKIVVVALGGNAVLPPGEKGTVKQQLKHVRDTVSNLKCLFGKYKVVITHGNGPQVGNLMLQQSNSRVKKPLDVLGAMTQGQLGYLLQSALGKKAVTVVTQVIVSRERKKTKPVGPYYRTKKEKDVIKEPEGWRKLVVSPKPKEIVELGQIKTLLKGGFTVISCGGGGIPVTRDGRTLKGVEGVIDKDRTSSLLASKLNADLLVFLTDVDSVYWRYESKDRRPIRFLDVIEAKKSLAEFKEGSMRPKIEASIDFIKKSKGKVIITKPELLDKALRRKAGTVIQ